MTASDRATLVGGLLAAADRLRADITPEATIEALEQLVGPATIWCSTLPVQEGWELYDESVNRPPAEWVGPEPAIADAAASALDAGWAHISRLLDRPTYLEPVIRLMTRSLNDSASIEQLAAGLGLPVTTFLPAELGEWRWRWPLRVGLVRSASSAAHRDAMYGDHRYAELYDIEQLDDGSSRPCDILVVGPDERLDVGRLGVVVVIGDDHGESTIEDQLHHGERFGPGAVIAVPGDDLSWFPHFIRELSHDRPIDAAIGLVRGDAATLGDPRFLAATTVRNWMRSTADRAAQDGDSLLADHLNDIAFNARFDSEQGPTRSGSDAVRGAEQGGAPMRELLGSSGARAAMPGPPEAEPPAAAPPAEAAPPVAATPPAATPPRTAGTRPTRSRGRGSPTGTRPTSSRGRGSRTGPEPTSSRGHPSAAPAPPHAGAVPDDEGRGLVARVTDAKGVARVGGFVAGRVHFLELRIAAGGSQDEIVASHPLQSPAPDRSVDLDVTVLVEGAKHGKPLIKLHYPASGDGPWTPAVKFTAPRRKGTLTIYVTVQWKGRVLQSATLTGPLLAKVSLRRRKPALTLTVDESSSGLASPERQGADATMLQLPDAGSSPVLIDANSAAPIDPDVLAQAVRQVRRSLISTFLEPPTDLAGAAPRLADLAVRGSLLRDALRGRDDDFFDDATWIHVTSFGGSTIPFELIYTHPMPDLSSTVEVCGPALADASTCAGDCAERTRTDRVCPFGFWGTSKIVERRQHTAHRADHTASEQRQVPVRTGGVVAVTDQANLDDPTAGSRIAAAITGFVAVGSGVTAANWTDLEQAVAETRNILCLVTHTIEPDDPEDDLAVELQLGGESRRLVAIDRRFFNPAARQPGPIVLALGCDTATIHASFATFVSRLHGFGAEVVVSAISQIPGKEVADFVERLMTSLDETLQQPGEHRFGAVMTAVRRETLRHGDVLALALTATGDGDVRIGAA